MVRSRAAVTLRSRSTHSVGRPVNSATEDIDASSPQTFRTVRAASPWMRRTITQAETGTRLSISTGDVKIALVEDDVVERAARPPKFAHLPTAAVAAPHLSSKTPRWAAKFLATGEPVNTRRLGARRCPCRIEPLMIDRSIPYTGSSKLIWPADRIVDCIADSIMDSIMNSIMDSIADNIVECAGNAAFSIPGI